MGIPYSKQINAAFDQVTPLVAAGFEVLETTKNIAVLLMYIEILTIVLLALILISLIAILITINPDLEEERKILLTPILKWITRKLIDRIEYARRYWLTLLTLIVFLYLGALYLYYLYTLKQAELVTAVEKLEEQQEAGNIPKAGDEGAASDDGKDSKDAK